ncbi:MAG: sigma-70 family RNA polymerase sigma factor [Planctomycetota bacterium]
MTETRTIEELRRHGQFAKRVALALVGDVSLADDLMQDAWLRALVRPPTVAGGSGRGWLTTVLRNLARQRRRSDATRVARERAYHDGETTHAAATADVVARVQAQRAVVDAVFALPVPLRAVVLLSYFEELDSPTIGRRLGVAPSTVRTRMQEALTTLRRRLEAKHGRQVRDWLPVIAPLLTRPPAARPPLPLATAPGLGATARVTRLAACAGAPLILAGLGAFWTDSDHPEPPSRRNAVAPAAPSSALRGAAPLASSSRTPPARTATRTRHAARPQKPTTAAAAPAATPAPTASFLVQVMIDGQPAPAASGLVFVRRQGGFVPEDPTQCDDVVQAPIASAGVARFADVPTVSSVGAQLPGGGVLHRAWSRSANNDDRAVLELGTARIEGVVYDTDGQPAANVELSLGIKLGHDYGALGARRRTDRSGRFEIQHLPAASFWLYAEIDGRPRRLHGELARGERRYVAMNAPLPLQRVTGRLLAADGTPSAGAAPHTDGRLEFRRLGAPADRDYTVVPLGADGHYTARVNPGAYRVRVMPHCGAGMQTVGELLVGRADIEQDFTLARPSVRGRLVTPPGTAAAGVTLRLTPIRESGDTAGLAAGAGADGTFVFDGVAPGRWRLTAAPQVPRVQVATQVTVPEGAVVVYSDLVIQGHAPESPPR